MNTLNEISHLLNVEIIRDYNNKSISPIDEHKSNKMCDTLIVV